MPRYRWLGPVFAALVATACAPTGSASVSPSASSARLEGTLRIFAASSLTEAFNGIAREFTSVHPAVTFATNYAGSSGLVAQILQGAEADVFASADEANMQKLVEGNMSAGSSRVFAQNRLQIVVQAGNPRKITGLADLARPDVIVVLGASSVPVGAYAQQAFDKAGIKVTPKSLETDVKLVVSKVVLGEADAGIVYTTDVKAGGPKIEGIDIPAALNVMARYPITLVRGSRNEPAARAFVDFVLSERGRAMLASFGFVLP